MDRQQIVIMVGPDRSGKTQIAKELGWRLDIPCYKASSEHSVFLGDQKQFINDIRYADPRLVDFIKQTNASVVMDRGFPCERVYSHVFQRSTDLEAIRQIDESYASLGAVVVVCLRKNGYEGIVDDLDPDRIDSAMLQKIHNAYVEYVAGFMKCKYMFLYVDDEDLDREVNEIIEFLGQ